MSMTLLANYSVVQTKIPKGYINLSRHISSILQNISSIYLCIVREYRNRKRKKKSKSSKIESIMRLEVEIILYSSTLFF